MKPTVYIETTIPSFYYYDRTEADMVVVRDWTREWWREESLKYELVSSIAVVDELKQGDHPNKEDKIRLLGDVRMLELAVETDEIVETYLRHKLMPKDLSGEESPRSSTLMLPSWASITASRRQCSGRQRGRCLRAARPQQGSKRHRIAERCSAVTGSC